MQMGAGDVTPIAQAPSLQALLAGPTGQPLLSTLAEDASDLHLMHSDWQKLVRRAALRCVVNIPIESAMGVGRPDGCLTLGFQEPVDWDEQWWFRGIGLLRGWLAGLLSQQLKLRDLDLAEAMLAASDLTSLARCFVHQMPEVLRRVHGAAAEVRLAVVSSRMVRARVYIDDSATGASAVAAAAVQSGLTLNLRKGPVREPRRGRLAEGSGAAVPGANSAPMVAAAGPAIGNGRPTLIPLDSKRPAGAAAALPDASSFQPSPTPGDPGVTAVICGTPAIIIGDGSVGGAAMGEKASTASAPLRRGKVHDSSWSANRVGDLAGGSTQPPTRTTALAPGASPVPATSCLNFMSDSGELSAKRTGPAPVVVPAAGRRRASVHDPIARSSQRPSPTQRLSVRASTYAGLMQIGGGEARLAWGLRVCVL